MNSFFHRFCSSVFWRYYSIFNYLYLKKQSKCIGKNCRIIGKVSINMGLNSSLEIGDDFTCLSGADLNPISRNLTTFINVEDNAKIIIGNSVGISSSTLWAKNKITIGDNVMIGADSIILDTDCHSLQANYRNMKELSPDGKTFDSLNTKCSPVEIKKNTLIGARCIILKGVTIGEGTVIGAGSVVSNSIPAGVIAAGNPCKVLKNNCI